MAKTTEEVIDQIKNLKIRFHLDTKDEGEIETEDLWAEPVGDSRFRLLNSPFYAFGVSADDIVIAEHKKEGWTFVKVESRGGHSTYRVYLQKGKTIQDPEFTYYWKPIGALGANFENANGRFFAVDVPPAKDIKIIYKLLQAVEDSGFWTFEEVHYEPSI